MNTKLIKIPHMGPIYAKGGVHGPILSPYNENVQTIGLMVMGGVSVVEVLSNGRELPLTITNFDKVNDPKTAAVLAEKEAHMNAQPVEPPTPVQQEEVKPVEPPQPQQPQQKQHEGKKNKFKPDHGQKK